MTNPLTILDDTRASLDALRVKINDQCDAAEAQIARTRELAAAMQKKKGTK